MAINTINFVQQENKRLKDENQQLGEELRALREFVRILNDLYVRAHNVRSDAELLPLMKDILQKALRLMNAPDGSLMLLDDETDELVFVIVQGTLSANLEGYRISANQGIAGWVMQSGEPALVRDVRHDGRFSHLVDEAFKFKTQSLAAAPLIGEGKVYGVVEVLNQPGDNPFSENDLALLRLMCRAAGEALADIERFEPIS